MPKFILSKKQVLEQYNVVDAIADNVSYSSKTNQDVTPILEKETDCMFSVHLLNELQHIKDMSRVLFLAQGWDAKGVKVVLNKGIRTFVVDNEMDLDVLLEVLEEIKIEITLFFRLKLKENTIRTEKYYVFGMPSEIIAERVRALKDHACIKKLGLHFHRKTQNMSEWNLQYELVHLFDDNIWEALDVVNIGGGLPVAYANTNMDVLKGIFEKIESLKTWLHDYGVTLTLEPGRFIAGPACKLVTKVVSVHENTVIVDASVYSGDMDALIVPVKLLIEGELPKGKAYIVKGITPCSLDIFRYKVYLDNVEVGKELVFLNAGAYNFASDFCDLEKVETEVIE